MLNNNLILDSYIRFLNEVSGAGSHRPRGPAMKIVGIQVYENLGALVMLGAGEFY